MKQIATTPEQSQRLIALGIDPNITLERLVKLLPCEIFIPDCDYPDYPINLIDVTFSAEWNWVFYRSAAHEISREEDTDEWEFSGEDAFEVCINALEGVISNGYKLKQETQCDK